MIRWLKKVKRPSAIDKLRSEKVLIVTFEELSRTPFDNVEDIYPERPKAITCTRIRNPDNDDTVSFKVCMKAGEEWHNHFHDCKETILIYEGTLYNILSNKQSKSLEVMVIEPYQKHIIKALEDTVFYVEFKDPQK